jgi:uncharacterized protein YjiS (DUF1127 family)
MEKNKLIDLFTRATHQLAAATKAFWQRRASVSEIDRLDGQEMTCLVRDLGISAEEIRVLAATDKSAADLLIRRMQTLGLDPTRVDHAVMRDLQRCCSKCTEKGLCIHELEDQPREPTWPQYCPNEQTLAALTTQAPSGEPACAPEKRT